MQILRFFRQREEETGGLAHDFTDPQLGTRFLGDLYQNLSKAARERYALCQTPGFVVDFILDRTLTPALDVFGLEATRLIDPTCGSGHFLLASFDRLYRKWQDRELDGKLAALNHGSIQVAIPGTEAAAIWKKCQDWASRVGEIKINGEGVDAAISLQLSGVDTAVIVANAAHEDNGGNRLRALKQLLFDELGLKGEARDYEFRWKATERSAELRFINVWEADDAKLKPSSDGWQVVIDFPFDRDGRTPKDDIDRLNDFTARNPGGGLKTLVWLPSFFSLETQRELGRLVILDFLMANEQRLKDYSPHLSAVDRGEARTLLENQRTQLRGRLQKALRQAYGVMNAEPGILDPSHQLELSDQFRSLEGSLDLRAPTEATLADALKAILAKALEHEFPGHPDFREDEVRITDGLVKRAFEKMSDALASPELRILIDKETRRQLRPLLEPLGLAHVGDQWLLVERDWMDHFDRCDAQHSGPVTVEDLRRWIDWKAPGQPKPKGLPVSLQNLIIHTYCLQSNRLLVQQGLTLPPGHTPLRDEILVEKQELPDQQSWTKAVDRAGKVFGVTGLPLASAQNMAKLAAEVRAVAGQHGTPAENYLRKLRSVLGEAKLLDPKTAQVAPVEHGGWSRWLGESQPLRFELCQAVRRVLLCSAPCEIWSRRAATEIDQARQETITVATDALVIERDNSRDRTTWWTFAGLLGNAEVAAALSHCQPYFDNFAITMSVRPDLRRIAPDDLPSAPRMPASATGRVKFQECLPPDVLAAMQGERSSDHDAAAFVRQSPVLWRESV